MAEHVAAGQHGHLLEFAGFGPDVGARDAGGLVADGAVGAGDGDGGVGVGFLVDFRGDFEIGVDVGLGGGRRGGWGGRDYVAIVDFDGWLEFFAEWVWVVGRWRDREVRLRRGVGGGSLRCWCWRSGGGGGGLR